MKGFSGLKRTASTSSSIFAVSSAITLRSAKLVPCTILSVLHHGFRRRGENAEQRLDRRRRQAAETGGVGGEIGACRGFGRGRGTAERGRRQEPLHRLLGDPLGLDLEALHLAAEGGGRRHHADFG